METNEKSFKRVNARVQSDPEKFQITITDFGSSSLAVISAYDALESAVHTYMNLPKRPLPELVGYLRGSLGLSRSVATVQPIPPGTEEKQQ